MPPAVVFQQTFTLAPPGNVPPTIDDGSAFSQSWQLFFQGVSDQLAILTTLYSQPSYASDAAAAAAGLRIGAFYRNGSFVCVRAT